mgnify:CR=1 FL=1
MGLTKKIENLPLGRYVIGDNAYVCTEHLLTPFPGEQRNQPEFDVYNFYVSQLRIRIEMTFGRFMNRWCLFNRPLKVKLTNVGKVFMCAARLHNFCSDEREGGTGDVLFLEETEVTEIPASDETLQVPGNSLMRDMLVEQVFHSGLSRPRSNRPSNA